MRNLVAFFLKHQFFSLFIILEIIAFVMISRNFSYQRMLRFHAVSDITGDIYKNYQSVTKFFYLKEENRQLLNENSVLFNMLLTDMLAPDSCLKTHEDSSYVYIPAIVVHNTVNRNDNFILLDKGEKQGIKKEMGVVSGKGIAGIIIGVSKNYSIAISLLNTHAHISARIKKNNQLVNVVWSKNHDQSGEVIDIPAHVRLQKGDTIVTSGNSFIFPAGLNIGVVSHFMESKNNNLNKAQLQFCTEFNSLRHVYIIKNLDKAEKIKLLEKAEDE